MTPMRTWLICNHIDHHARNSGYDQLAFHVEGEPYRSGGGSRILARALPWKLLKRVPAIRTNWYNKDALRREIEICLRILAPRGDIYHFLYPENDLRLSSTWPVRFNNKIVATFHQPPDFMEQHFQDKSCIRGLDGAVVLSSSQIPYLTRFLPENRVFLVPHGVDTKFWNPGPGVSQRAPSTFLMVGQWMRDFETAGKVVLDAAQRELGIHFRVVGPREREEEFKRLPATEFLCGISDEDLREEYRRATALFLPLLDSTANNAILESMACGTPVVSTMGGCSETYLNEDCAIVVDRGDVGGLLRALLSLADKPEKVERMGRSAREKAENFSWEIVGGMMNQVYRKIRGRPAF